MSDSTKVKHFKLSSTSDAEAQAQNLMKKKEKKHVKANYHRIQEPNASQEDTSSQESDVQRDMNEIFIDDED